MLTRDLAKIENQGFPLTPNGRELQAMVAEMRARKQETTLLLWSPGQTKESREAAKLACETLANPNTSTHKLLNSPEMMLSMVKSAARRQPQKVQVPHSVHKCIPPVT